MADPIVFLQPDKHIVAFAAERHFGKVSFQLSPTYLISMTSILASLALSFIYSDYRRHRMWLDVQTLHRYYYACRNKHRDAKMS